MEEVKRVNQDPDFHVFMSAEEDNQKIENSIREEMTEKGLKEGMEKGLEQGQEQGLEQANRQIVMTMLKEGLDISTISKYTKLEKKFIEKCQKDFEEQQEN